MKHELKVIQTADASVMTAEYNKAVAEGWKGAAIQHYVVGDHLIHCATLIKYDEKEGQALLDSIDSTLSKYSGGFGGGSFGGGMTH